MKYIIDTDDIENDFNQQIQKAPYDSTKKFYETIKLTVIQYVEELGEKMEDCENRRSESIKYGIMKSNKKSGRKTGQLDKMTDELREDIEHYLKDRTIKQVDLMKKHNISRNTLKKYIAFVKQKHNNYEGK